MPQCQAYGCRNKPHLCKGKSFFKIPNGKLNPRLRDKSTKWLHYIGTGHTLDSFVFNRHKLVCEDHFSVDCFTEDQHIRMSKLLQRKPRYNKTLHDWAVPTVIIHRPPKEKYGKGNRMRNQEAKKHAKIKKKLTEVVMAMADPKKGRKKVLIQCCVPECASTNTMAPNILFFPFPKSPEMLKIWLTAVRKPEIIKDISNEKPCRIFICVKHFKESDLFIMEGRTCLKAGVVPSLFSWTESAAIKSVTSKQKSDEVEEDIVKVTCGNITGMLHLDRFYCPGIHHECIKYNNQFVTPKMFMIMGDKKKSKNWKSAIRVTGTMFNKCLESGKIKYYRHSEFCSGRCKPHHQHYKSSRLLAKRPPDARVNRSSNISHIKFLPEDKVPEACLQSQIKIENEVVDEDEINQEIEEEMDDSEEKTESLDGDEKPDYTDLRNILTNPLPSMITKSVSRVKGGITDNAVFWRGIVKLHLIENVFDVILQKIDSLHNDIISHQVLKEDAHLLSSIVREMGLSDKIQQMLASCQQDMDSHFAKLDQEMEELKKKVQQYENKKEMLIQQSHEFREILELNKNTGDLQCNSEDSETEFDEGASRTTETNKRPSEVSPYAQAALVKRLKSSTNIVQSTSQSPPKIVLTPELTVSQILTPYKSQSAVFPMFIVENKAFASTKVQSNPNTLTASVKDTIHMPNTVVSGTSAKNKNDVSNEQLTVKEPIIINMEKVKEFGSGNLKKCDVIKGAVKRECIGTSDNAAPKKLISKLTVFKLVANAPLKRSQSESLTLYVDKSETKKLELRSINTDQSETVSENDVRHSSINLKLTETSSKNKRDAQDVDQSNDQKTNADQSMNVTVNCDSQSKSVTDSVDIKLESVDSDTAGEERAVLLKRPVVKLIKLSENLDASTLIENSVTKPLDATSSVDCNVRRSSRKIIIKVVKDM